MDKMLYVIISDAKSITSLFVASMKIKEIIVTSRVKNSPIAIVKKVILSLKGKKINI